MEYSKRTKEWTEKFYKHLEVTNPDLLMYFYTNIFFSPNMENNMILHVGFNPLNDNEELKEIRERMFNVFEEFRRSNPV